MSTMQTQTPTTWEDVLRMPDDGNRYEFIGGRLYMTPAPVTRHQRVVMRLCSALSRILVDSRHGEAFCAPLLVEFPGTGDRVQPDLLFISNARHGVREYWIVDPDEDVVDVWRFGDESGHKRFSGELPVRLGPERLGLIDLDEVFSRHLDVWAEGT